MVTLHDARAVMLDGGPVDRIYHGLDQIWPYNYDTSGELVARWHGDDWTGSPWVDRQQGINPVTQGSSPVAATILGIKTVRFRGTDVLRKAAPPLGVSAPGITSFVLMDYVGGTGTRNAVFLSTSGSSSSARFSHRFMDNKLAVAGRRRDTDSLGTIVSPNTVPLTDWFVSAVRLNYQGASGAVFVNGVKENEGAFQTSGLTDATTSTHLVLGASGSYGEVINGYFAEILIYRGALSDSTVANISEALMARVI